MRTNGTTQTHSNIMLLDPHPILLHGLEILFQDQRDLTLCWKGSDAAEAWKALDKALPDLLILDLSLDNADGIDFIKNLHAFWPKLPILVFSSREETFYAERALRAGAKGYLMKNQPTAAILAAIRTVAKGEIYLTDRMRDRMVTQALSGRHSVQSSPCERLTDRELEVFRLLGLGYGTRRVAEELRLSVKTIETYRAHIMDKLNLKKSTELILHAFQWVNSDSESSNGNGNARPASPASLSPERILPAM